MKRFTTTLTVLLVIFAFAAPLAIASAYKPFEGICKRDQAVNAAVCNETATGDPLTGVDGVIVQVVQMLGIVAGVAAVILIIVAGLKFVTSNGDTNGISSAKRTILYAVIGLIIIILAQPIIRFLVKAI